MSAIADPVLARLQRRLDREALEQLRRAASELADRLDAAENTIDGLQDDVDFWRERAQDLERALDQAGVAHRVVGLTQAGALVLTDPEPRA